MSNNNVYTTSNGCPVFSPYASQQIGHNTPGPLLLQDHHLLDLLAHFDRERIPERVVHAKGSGAYGEFEATDDVSDLTVAAFLKKGTKTKTFTRFSTVGGESGSADTARDPRGFATKFYTQEGIIDWVYNNTPIFFLRNPSKFPLFIHTQKRNPRTHLKDADVFWDYLVQNQEAVHQLMHLFSDRGTPASYREMHGYSGHTYKWVKADGSFNYVQIHMRSDQGVRTLNNEEATKLAGENPDYLQEDLVGAIDQGKFPSWTCYVQVISPEQAKTLPFSVFDLTKTWPQGQFPLRRFGKLTLNKNAENYFAEVEQSAFSPSNTVPGWEPSADPVLQSRLFSYPDTHRHRLGANFYQIPVNRCPFAHNPYIRDGAMSVDGNHGSLPNYPSSFQPIQYRQDVAPKSNAGEEWIGTTAAFHWDVVSPQDYEQAGKMWEVFGKTGQQDALIHNLSVHVSGAKPHIQEKVFEMFGKVHPDFGQRLRKEVIRITQRKQPNI